MRGVEQDEAAHRPEPLRRQSAWWYCLYVPTNMQNTCRHREPVPGREDSDPDTAGAQKWRKNDGLHHFEMVIVLILNRDDSIPRTQCFGALNSLEKYRNRVLCSESQKRQSPPNGPVHGIGVEPAMPKHLWVCMWCLGVMQTLLKAMNCWLAPHPWKGDQACKMKAHA